MIGSRGGADLAFLFLRRILGVVGGDPTPDAKDVEIAVLRHQLAVLRRQVTGPRYTPTDRIVLATLAKLLARDRWKIFLVTPSTLLRWHRELVRCRWTYPTASQRRGLDPAVVELVLRLARDNARWGYLRIVEQRPDPTIVEPTDAIIRLAATCICGSDLWPYRGAEPVDHQVMGHEYAGVVEAVGSEVRTVKVGDFVVGSFWASDNICEICQVGYQAYCVHRVLMGTIGTQAELARIPLADGTLVAAPGQPDPDRGRARRRVRALRDTCLEVDDPHLCRGAFSTSSASPHGHAAFRGSGMGPVAASVKRK